MLEKRLNKNGKSNEFYLFLPIITFYPSKDDKTCPEDCSEMIDENMHPFNRNHNSANSHK
jgi:hypothetical protein|tara:strand:- start:16 stop:195 length:180 start_codon:yes stop_codon:yes gene_type:complete